MYLANLASAILMIHRKDRFRAQKSLAARVMANPKIEVRFNTELRRIQGTPSVSTARLVDNRNGAERDEQVSAVFVFIGSDPKSALVAGMGVELDETGYVKTDERMQTSVPGLYAAGDVRASPFRQLVVAASEGAIAAHAAGQYIDETRGEHYR
jgi:thioredoxin reductase (NADPH)